MEPELRPLCTVTNIGGKTVVSAEIQEIDNELKPCFYKGVGRLKGSYVRVGDGDRHMTEYEVYSFEAFRKKIQDELRIAERAGLSDIDTDAHTQYLITMRRKKPNLADLPTEKIDSLQGFTTDGRPTLAGVMMFSPYPQGFFPQLCVTAVCVQGTEMGSDNAVGERFIDNARIDGNIVNMLDESISFVRRNMKTATCIDPQTGRRSDKPEYPVVAVRELILNALVHRVQRDEKRGSARAEIRKRTRNFQGNALQQRQDPRARHRQRRGPADFLPHAEDPRRNRATFQRQTVDKLPDGAHHSSACRAGENQTRHSRQTPQQKSEVLQLK